MARKSAGSQKSAWPERAPGGNQSNNKRWVSNERLDQIIAYVVLLAYAMMVQYFPIFPCICSSANDIMMVDYPIHSSTWQVKMLC